MLLQFQRHRDQSNKRINPFGATVTGSPGDNTSALCCIRHSVPVKKRTVAEAWARKARCWEPPPPPPQAKFPWNIRLAPFRA